jgi:hypothetical protein
MGVNLFQQVGLGIGLGGNQLSSVALLDSIGVGVVNSKVGVLDCWEDMMDGKPPLPVFYTGPHFVSTEDRPLCDFDRTDSGQTDCTINPELIGMYASQTCTTHNMRLVRFCLELSNSSILYNHNFSGMMRIYESYDFIAPSPFPTRENLEREVASYKWNFDLTGYVPSYRFFVETLLDTSRSYIVTFEQSPRPGHPTPSLGRYFFRLDECWQTCDRLIDIDYEIIYDDCGFPVSMQVRATAKSGLIPYIVVTGAGNSQSSQTGVINLRVVAGNMYLISAGLNRFDCTKEINVEVRANPKISVSLDIQRACDGCLIVAGASGGTPPYGYQWSLSPIKLQSPMPPLPTIAKIVGTSANKFRRIPCDDGSTYYCLVTDSRGCLGVGSITVPKQVAGEGARAYRREVPLVTVTPIRMISEIPCIWEVSVSTNPGEYPYTFEWLDSRGNVIKSEKGKTSATFITQIGGGQLRYRIRNLVGCESPVEMINLPCKYDDRRRDGDDPVHPVPGRRDDGGIDNIYGGIRIGPIGIVGSPGQIRVGGEVNRDSRIGTMGIVGALGQFPESKPVTPDSERPVLRYTAEI